MTNSSVELGDLGKYVYHKYLSSTYGVSKPVPMTSEELIKLRLRFMLANKNTNKITLTDE